ncbi:hypothetical protein E8E13_005723 [Curvularia kusanoi]|uniref:Uncharacterized protein n=1 Tax=Curvularia kusanoi TaxID=90978 RepID=A0A9P4WDA9_CURKU|nr:hypothetical protein E8E13_005723 [Curvularia kusanoi]
MSIWAATTAISNPAKSMRSTSIVSKTTFQCHGRRPYNLSSKREKPDGALPVGYYPPIQGIEVANAEPEPEPEPEPERCLSCGTDSKDNKDSYNCDYKALSNADEDEWSTGEERNRDQESQSVHDDTPDQLHTESISNQLRHLPQYLEQRQQTLSSIPPGFTSDAYALGHHSHNLLAHIADLAPPSALHPPYWHANLSPLYRVPSIPSPSRTDDYTPQFHRPATQEAATSTLEPQHPATPLLTPPTGPRHSLTPRSFTPRPTPPFVVGTVTDAFLRVEAARTRHWRERARRPIKPFFPDTLPVRSMALEDFMVDRTQKRAQPGGAGASPVLEDDAQSGLSLTDEDILGHNENYMEGF